MIIQKTDFDHDLIGKKYKALAFDVDNTLRRALNPQNLYPTQGNDWDFQTNVLHVLHTYYTPISHLHYALITNQSGIAKGTLSFVLAKDMLTDLATAVFKQREYDIYLCSHAFDADCACRKPSPYFLLRFAFTRSLKLSDILYVGDMRTDWASADRAGVDFMWAHTFFDW